MGISIPLTLLGYPEKVMLCSKVNKSILNLTAIFSDETENYRKPAEPLSTDTVNILLRTEKNDANKIYIIYSDKKVNMNKKYTEGIFDFYEVILPPTNETIEYYFEIEKNGISFFYNKLGISNDIPQNGNFKIIRNFKVPSWARGAIMYQIYVDRFYNGDKKNDVETNEYIYLGKPSEHISDWYQLPSTDDVRNFYGGDLQGVIDKISYLKDLGVEVIYFNPIFVSPSNHKYDIQDYDYVDPHIGVIVEDGGSVLEFEKFNNRHATMYIKRTTDKANLEASNKLFIKLVEIAHKNGIKVILDGVFNHCGAFNKWLDREGFYMKSGKYPEGAYKDKNSIYHDYFRWYDSDNWPNNDCYDGWWGYDNHPKLNYEASKDLYNYILKVGAKWVSPPYNADGWRLDVAADLGYSEEFNHKFWRDFRKAVKKANPNAIILAEHYGDASSWLAGDQWDTVMNYDAFMEPITWFLTGMEKHSEEFRGDLLCNGKVFKDSIKYHMSKLSYQSLMISMNELSNHDHSRFLTRTNMTVGRLHTKGSQMADFSVNEGIMKEAVTFQMTWPGAPTIYYGDEAGVTGWTDPDNRRTYPWGRENKELIDFHKAIISIHKKYNVLKTGSVEFLLADYGVLSYGRFDNKERMVVILNNNIDIRTFKVPVWQIGVEMNGNLERIIISTQKDFSVESKFYHVRAGILEIELPAYSSIVLKECK